MSEAKHTPGPWQVPHFANDDFACNCRSVLSEHYAGGICFVDSDNGLPVGKGGNDGPPLEEAKANARLIAAAPDMLAFIKDFLVIYDGMQDGDGDEAPELELARLIVAKAEGRS